MLLPVYSPEKSLRETCNFQQVVITKESEIKMIRFICTTHDLES